ncbi:MAG: tetratricopeptide repeat protein [Chloroflexota bacterium]|nr:tetratricopeptide repeat protein [Chloroflexota bacterium]
MKIRRDYTQPFFRQPKRHPIRNMFIAAGLGLLLGLAIVWQQEAVKGALAVLAGSGATPTPRPEELAARASQGLLEGDVPGAEALLATAVAERPQDVGFLYQYGRALIELGRSEEALALGEAITGIDARDTRGFALKAAALTWGGQPASAIPIALAGLELNPRFIPLHATLARAYVDEQRWADGLEAGERGLSISDDDAELNRAYAYALQSVGSYGDAISYLQRAIELRPAYLPTHFELAGLFLARDEDQSAIDIYDHILAIDPRNARAMLRLCLAYRKIGEFARALGFCEDSVTNDSTDPEAQFQLGLLYYRERRFEGSRAAFQQCLDHDEGVYDLSCRYRLGLSHYYTGDCTTGWGLLRDSLDLARASGDEITLGNILQGLDAIESDPKCIEDAVEPVTIQD